MIAIRIIDYEKVKSNILDLQKTNRLILVLKNDGYHLGEEKLLEIVRETEIKFVACLNMEEASRIRSLDAKVEILLLAGCDFEVKRVQELNLIVTIDNLELFQHLKEESLRVHLKIRSDMNRFGMTIKEASKVLSSSSNLTIEGIYVHFAKQTKRFSYSSLREKIKKEFPNLMLHFNLPFADDYYRLANKVYENSLSIVGKVIRINKLRPFHFLGYNHSFFAFLPIRYAIIDVGYLDGLSKEKRKRYCLCNHQRCFIIGNSCMNHSFIRVNSKVSVGNEVILLGKDISLEQFLQMNRLSSYELLLKNH